MSRNPHRRWSRALLVAGAGAVAVASAGPAFAAEVGYHGACRRDAQVVQWSPKKGAIARFVADTFASNDKTGLWIGLGRSGSSFWSAEGGDPNDACDDCRELYLVETKSDGARKLHPVFKAADHPDKDAEARKALVLRKLWKLARTTWPADKLTQDYTFTAGRPPAKDPEGDPPFAARVERKGTFDLRYDLGAKTEMCWCFYEWRVKSVTPAQAAAPKK